MNLKKIKLLIVKEPLCAIRGRFIIDGVRYGLRGNVGTCWNMALWTMKK